TATGCSTLPHVNRLPVLEAWWHHPCGLARSNIWPRRLLKIRSPKMRNLISQ
ncbi:unnamed protein product, partial [Ascophyllum nodosum]